MNCRRSLGIWLLTVVLAAVTVGLTARPACVEAGHGPAGHQADPFARAGYPHCVAPWARLTYTCKYCGYFVGGGAPLYGEPGLLRGEPRYPLEGTWGMDYDPWYSRVRLQWYHGERYQGGRGQYDSEHKNNPFRHFFGR